jgi:hypothetical protein
VMAARWLEPLGGRAGPCDPCRVKARSGGLQPRSIALNGR